MRYITGEHALNLSCKLETCGDWHTSALRWKNITFMNSEDSIYGDYGIEPNHRIPEHDEVYYVANHIRALLDLLDMGNFAVAQGMREDFICNEEYTDEVFEQVSKLKEHKNWERIKEFMGKEYKLDWVNFCKREGI